MSKRKGTRNERRSRECLEEMGFTVVRAAASLGLWDLVAVGSSVILLVQVKTNRWVGPDERAALEAVKTPPNCYQVQHRWDTRARVPRVRAWKNGAWEDTEGSEWLNGV